MNHNSYFEGKVQSLAIGTSAVWKYKVVYRLNDAQVGQWSDVATIGVMG